MPVKRAQPEPRYRARHRLASPKPGMGDVLGGGLGPHDLYSLRASAPPMISISSLVMAAWRARLYVRVSLSIASLAFLVAESMAVMRAPNSEAIDSSKARKIETSTYIGTKRSRSAARLGSKMY